ncbi:hypothetical protein ACPPVO_30215 [Dactylosporangium sp. McL0621]|uniref:hypothetical protein n=1 Tax=Dactylosporangium sp. McL0621 TaxID=3415678 RepID=UPI003CEE21DB
MAATRYSAPGHAAAYAAAAARAHAEVPYYRERDARAGAPDTAAPLPADRLARHYHELFPLAAPWRGESDPPAWLPDGADLAAALALTGRHRPGTPVFELRPALLDLRLPRGSYRVLLTAAADVDPTAPDPRPPQRAAFAATRPATLLGPPDDLARLAGAVDTAGALVLPVLPLAAARADPGRPALLYDEHLGWAGAWSAECGRAHLSWRALFAGGTPEGLLLTRLHRRRPTLVDVRPDGTAGLGVAACPRHGTPVVGPAGQCPPNT